MKCKICASLFFMAIFFVSCAQQNNNTTEGAIAQANTATTLDAPAFKAAIEKGGVQVLDVRTAPEFNSGHIAHALQANWTDLKEFEDRTQHLDKSTPVYIYCQAGGRSAAAQSYLVNKGYKVVNLEGGMSNWKMNRFAVDGGGDKPQMRIVDFQNTINANEYVLVDIGADWCPPCRKMIPVLESLKKATPHPFYLLAVDGGNDIDVMKEVGSEGLPTFIIYKNGKQVWKHQGIVALNDFVKALK